MRGRTVLLLLVVVVALATFIGFYERDLPSSKEREASASRVLGIDADAVRAVTIESSKTTVRLEKIDETGWRLLEPVDAQADGEAVDQMLAALGSLDKQRTLTEIDLSGVGLDPPRLSVVVELGDDSRELDLGEADADAHGEMLTFRPMECGVILVGAGEGRRFGRPKAFVTLGGRTLLEHAAAAFERFPHRVAVLRSEDLDDTSLPGWSLVAGGARRRDSVTNGLAALDAAARIVLIHDVARALVPADLVERVAAAAEAHPAVIPVVPVTDTIKRVMGDRVLETVPRDELAAVQTRRRSTATCSSGHSGPPRTTPPTRPAWWRPWASRSTRCPEAGEISRSPARRTWPSRRPF